MAGSIEPKRLRSDELLFRTLLGPKRERESEREREREREPKGPYKALNRALGGFQLP